MLEICYSPSEAINISGSLPDLEKLRQEVLKFIYSDLTRIDFQIENNINPSAWDFVAKHLQIVQNDKAVKVSILDENAIQIEGSKENLEKFTSFLVFNEDDKLGSHSHYEYFEGNEYIAFDSFPLIIGIN
jgi:hypothetical protein